MIILPGEPPYKGEGSHHEVGSGDWKSIQNDGLIETVGIGACIGLAISNRQQKLIFLGHFHAGTTKDLEEMVEASTEAIEDQGKTHVWMGGGDIEIPDLNSTNERVLESRDYVEEVIAQTYGKEGARIHRNWLDISGSIDFAMDAKTGKAYIDLAIDD